MDANTLIWLGVPGALVLIVAGTAWFVHNIEAVEHALKVRRGAIALVLPVFGPSGAAAIEALQPHHSLRADSIGFSLASTTALCVAGCICVSVGIRSINARIFQYFLYAIPIPITVFFVLADSHLSPFEGIVLIAFYILFVVTVWRIERVETASPPRSVWDGRAGRLASLAGAVALTVAGSVLLLAFARVAATDWHERNTAAWLSGSGIAAQVFALVWAALHGKRSDVAIAGVAGIVAFNSAAVLGTFGLTARHHTIEPGVFTAAALATLVVPVALFSAAFKQTKRLLPSEYRHETDDHMDNVFAWRNLKRDLSNYQLLRYRNIDGNLVTGMNSGTHWVTVMLATAIAKRHGLALPRYFSFTAAGDLVGIPKALVHRPGIPAIALSHNHPAAPLAWPVVRRLFPYPKQVVLVRDIREVLLSAYLKWMPNGEVPFSEFVRGDPANHHGYLCDVWWYLSYLNRWGSVKSSKPEDTLIVRYEDMVEDPACCLRHISKHFGLGLTEDSIEAALALRDKSVVMAMRDPKDTERVIADPESKARLQFSDDDMRELGRILARHLRYDFGYDYGLDVALEPIAVLDIRATTSTACDAVAGEFAA